MRKNNELDVLVPVSIDIDWPTKESVISDILEQYERYGFKRFMLACPGAGWRAVGYPPHEFFIDRARMFKEIKEALQPYGIECGWWITATLKSGRSEDFSGVVRLDGSQHPFANCPLDTNFKKRISSEVAAFSKIAKPAFIFTEDDYSIHAAGPKYGCMCDNHIKAFSKKVGREYTREELVSIFGSETEEGYKLLRLWRELSKDALVSLAEEIRRALDVDSPEIPMGYMQAGACDFDGDCTAAVSRAMAGPRHTPYSRLFGSFYFGVHAEEIPPRLMHALYTKQRIDGDFIFYHETDSFPHTRFFSSGKEMLAMMSAVYSMGFEGSVFQTQQLLDAPNEECAYALAFSRERKRLNALYNCASKCNQVGAEIHYDPFWNTACMHKNAPFWTKIVSMFCIPWITVKSDVLFLDRFSAKFHGDSDILDYLSRPIVFLDAEAAKILCERGFEKYIGVRVEEPVNSLPENSMLVWDLGSREVITEAFRQEGKGKNMQSAHMLASANGVMHKLTLTDNSCEVITEFYTYDKRLVTPSMTRFANSLGGTVVVMGTTISDNNSQALYNYRRQRIIQNLIAEHSDTLAFVREAPRVFVIMNEAKADCDFKHLLTMINLSSDTLCEAQIHLPPRCKDFTDVLCLGIDGKWERADYELTTDGIRLLTPIPYLESAYIMLK